MKILHFYSSYRRMEKDIDTFPCEKSDHVGRHKITVKNDEHFFACNARTLPKVTFDAVIFDSVVSSDMKKTVMDAIHVK